MRCAALEGLGLLADNPLTHALLKPALSKTAACLGDPALKVRVAFADLLLVIGSAPAVQQLLFGCEDAGNDLCDLPCSPGPESPQVGALSQLLCSSAAMPGFIFSLARTSCCRSWTLQVMLRCCQETGASKQCGQHAAARERCRICCLLRRLGHAGCQLVSLDWCTCVLPLLAAWAVGPGA